MRNQPYIIAAPGYTHKSAGIRVLHRLGHWLNEIGEQAYIYSANTNPEWNITSISASEAKRLIENGAIVVYPEVTSGNPLHGKTIVRYVLNTPGFLGGDKEYDPAEIVFCYSKQLLLPGLDQTRLLCIPTINGKIFFADNTAKDIEYLIYFGKHNTTGNYPKKRIITRDWPVKQKDLGQMLRRSKKLISYDNFTALNFEATLCGCPVIIIPDNFRKKEDIINSEYGFNGVAWGASEIEFEKAKSTLPLAPLVLKSIEEKITATIKNFITITQEAAQKQLANQPSLSLSLVIPNYNGIQHLQDNLATLIKNSQGATDLEIVVVDNGSIDGSVEYLNSNFPQIKVITLPHPMGFAKTCNSGAKAAKGAMLFFLNNDVRVSSDFLPPLLAHFKDPKVFAVTPSMLVPRMDNLNEALTSATFKGGAINVDFYASRRWKKQPHTALPILFGCGAALLVDRNKFSQLGGFDEGYSPFYYEDLDLSYRAQRRGWKVLCESKSIVYHLKEGTIAKEFKRRNIAVVRRRNQYLFIWKNIFDKKMLTSHFFELVLPKILIPNFVEWSALFQALRQFPAVLKERQKESKFTAIKDRDILNKVAYLLEKGDAPWQKRLAV